MITNIKEENQKLIGISKYNSSRTKPDNPIKNQFAINNQNINGITTNQK